MKRRLYYFLSPKLRLLVRRLYYFPIDFFEGITGKRDAITPPKGLIFIGPGNFRAIGETYLKRFVELAGLQPNHKILDVGCGIGRIAIPLTKYITTGKYDGFDIVKKGIDWCNKHISRHFPNFKFQHIDLKNDLYNLGTEREAKSFVFPYGDNEYDLVILTSVFTHMVTDDVENYLRQIERVLKPGGKCYATFFILNESTLNYMEQSKSFYFGHNYGNYRLMDNNVKEANIAYNEDFLKNMIERCNLKISNVYYGYWSSRPKEESLDFQDTMILRKV